MNKEIQESLDALLEDVNDRVDRFKRRLKALDEVKRVRMGMNGTYHPVTIEVPSYSATIKIHVAPSTMKEVGHYITKIRRLGYRRTYAYLSETSTPLWVFERPDEDGEHHQRLEFTADFSRNKGEDMCRMVEVGTTTREVPIMKLVCPDGQDFSNIEQEEEAS